MFTPVVTGIYLLLLVIQLSEPIVKGIMGIGYRKNEMDVPVFLLACVIMLATFLMSRSNVPFLKQYSILIALFGGWILFAVFGAAKLPVHTDELFHLPDIFPFGVPLFDSGLVVTSLFITVLLIVNMLASIRVVEGAVKQFEKLEERKRARPAGFIASVSHLLSGLLGAVGTVPISGAAGFIQTTRISSKKPFLLGSLIVILISFFPFVMNAFASLLSLVGFAVNFVVFSTMVGMAFSEFDSYGKSEAGRVRFVIGIALLAGSVSCLFLKAPWKACIPFLFPF